jgi:predicted CXXCH cytochrome family protein
MEIAYLFGRRKVKIYTKEETMKKLFVVLGAVLLLAGLSLAQTIAGSAHDFSGAIWNGGGEICVVCHTPHNAAAAIKPLWNHATSVATYVPYPETSAHSTPGAPAGSSLICLSCHDGTVGLGNFGGVTDSTNYISTEHNVSTDLSNDHPISVDYNVANGLHLTSAALGSATIADVLESNQVQCASCHNVHNEAGETSLLRASNAGSLLCLACHIK